MAHSPLFPGLILLGAIVASVVMMVVVKKINQSKKHFDPPTLLYTCDGEGNCLLDPNGTKGQPYEICRQSCNAFYCELDPNSNAYTGTCISDTSGKHVDTTQYPNCTLANCLFVQ